LNDFEGKISQGDEEFFSPPHIYQNTVRAPNFAPLENFPYLLGKSVALQVDSVIRMKNTNSADLNDF
jgi:hypothetical protein